MLSDDTLLVRPWDETLPRQDGFLYSLLPGDLDD